MLPRSLPCRFAMGLTGLSLLTGCSWQPDWMASGWIQWSPAGNAISIESDDGILLADRTGEVIANLNYASLPQPIDPGTAQPYHWYRWFWPDVDSLTLLRWTSFQDRSRYLDIWRVPLASGEMSEPAHFRFTTDPDILERIISVWQPSESAPLRLLTYGSAETGGASIYRIVDLPSQQVAATLEVNWDPAPPVFDPRASRLWWLARAGTGADTGPAVMYANIAVDRGVIEGPFSCGTLPSGRPEQILLPQLDGSLKVRLFYWQNRTESGAMWNLVDVQCDPSPAGLRIATDRTFEGPEYPNYFSVNSVATEVAFFRDKGEFVVRSLVDGAERTAMFDKPSWLHINYGYFPVDGRALNPVWLDDRTVCTLWPSETVRDRLEVVVWEVTGVSLIPHNISEGWSAQVRPEHLEVKQVFNPTL